MTKEQESALTHLKRLVGILIYPDDISAIKVGIQAIKDLDTYREPYNKGYEDGVKATQVSASLTFEDILDEIKAEIQSNMETITGKYDSSVDLTDMPSYKIERNTARGECLQIIDKYEKVVSKDADGD